LKPTEGRFGHSLERGSQPFAFSCDSSRRISALFAARCGPDVNSEKMQHCIRLAAIAFSHSLSKQHKY